jgi:E3 ubiquitin-protein ligase UBR1
MLGLNNSFERGPDHELEGFDQACFSGIDDCKEFVKKYALVFLRKASLLLYVRYGTDFNSFFPHESDELGRLSESLRLPSFDEICDLIGQQTTSKIDDIIDNDDQLSYDDISTTQHIIWGWIHAHFAWQSKQALEEGESDQKAKGISVSHPSIFELIGLPKNYDTLMEETMKGRCPTTGKDLTDPMLCLFCGAIFCGQAMCCLKEEERSTRSKPAKIGGAQQHMRK